MILPTYAAEETRWYEIEVIVFKNKSGNVNEELWPDHLAVTYPDDVIDFMSEFVYSPPENHITEKQAAEWILQQNSLTSEPNKTEVEKPETEIANDPQSEQPFVLLADEFKQLAPQYQSLSRSSQYTPLTHVVWRQPTKTSREAEWVRLVGGQDFFSTFKKTGESKADDYLYQTLGLTNYSQDVSADTMNDPYPSASATDSSTTTATITPSSNQSVFTNDPLNSALPEMPPVYIPVPELDGSIQIYLNRYLHINTQLFLRIPGKKEIDISSLNSSLSSSLLDMTNDGQMSSSFESGFSWNYQTDNIFDEQEKETLLVDRLFDYELNQSRRIRSGEIHYFDHPLFGIIIQVRPYEIKTEENSSLETTPNG